MPPSSKNFSFCRLNDNVGRRGDSPRREAMGVPPIIQKILYSSAPPPLSGAGVIATLTCSRKTASSASRAR